ncbi:hypothetical protein LG204_06980 [Methylovorus menthalis]|uniref:hypothetical protein n=1 Tax=Methylovorus menthalis TaxID=1002227 RepID=UPI001E3107AA|nr:hypothetical protein [Methylovorus menthalis]MCB4811055.1 hypothetical protein [Methylovorus menthalis]
MNVIEIPKEVNRFVLYFNTQKYDVNAYALATALIGLADAVKEVNAAVNPGYRVEVVVETLVDGSFQAVVRTVYEKAKNLFSNEAVKAIVYGIISTHIYETLIQTNTPPRIEVSKEMVIIESGDNKIIVDRSVYEAKKGLEKSERFNAAIGKVFHGALADPEVLGIGLKTDFSKPPPLIYVPRDRFVIFDHRRIEEDGVREIVEFANLEISRAILSRGNRKWEFFWRGIKISAPVMDSRFYDRFFAHEITIAPGDGLYVALRIVQRQDPDTGIFKNERYEVIEVHEHLPKMQQQLIKQNDEPGGMESKAGSW